MTAIAQRQADRLAEYEAFVAASSRDESIDLDRAEQVAVSLGKTLEDFESDANERREVNQQRTELQAILDPQRLDKAKAKVKADAAAMEAAKVIHDEAATQLRLAGEAYSTSVAALSHLQTETDEARRLLNKLDGRPIPRRWPEGEPINGGA
jgi:hypothetical protein